jgi:hypothetical protein
MGYTAAQSQPNLEKTIGGFAKQSSEETKIWPWTETGILS